MKCKLIQHDPKQEKKEKKKEMNIKLGKNVLFKNKDDIGSKNEKINIENM